MPGLAAAEVLHGRPIPGAMHAGSALLQHSVGALPVIIKEDQVCHSPALLASAVLQSASFNSAADLENRAWMSLNMCKCRTARSRLQSPKCCTASAVIERSEGVLQAAQAQTMQCGVQYAADSGEFLSAAMYD